jgi:hypothetical protein
MERWRALGKEKGTVDGGGQRAKRLRVFFMACLPAPSVELFLRKNDRHTTAPVHFCLLISLMPVALVDPLKTAWSPSPSQRHRHGVWVVGLV